MGIYKVKRFLKRYRKTIVFIFILAAGFYVAAHLVDAFLEILEGVSQKQFASIDDKILRFVQKNRTNTLTDIFKVVTFFGDQTIYLILLPAISFIIYKIYGRVEKAVQLILVVIIASLLNILLKDFIERNRPIGEHLVEVSSYSFPSGHTVSSLTFYGFLIYIFWTSGLKHIYKVVVTIPLILIILGVAISRIYLGVHYPSDVVAGLLAGGFFLLVFILAIYTTRFIKNNNKEKD